MAVQLDKAQSQTVYQILAGMDLERHQLPVEYLVALLGGKDAQLFLQLIRTVWEEGQSAAYQQGIRIGESYGAETALRLFHDMVRKNGLQAAGNKGQTEAAPL